MGNAMRYKEVLLNVIKQTTELLRKLCCIVDDQWNRNKFGMLLLFSMVMLCLMPLLEHTHMLSVVKVVSGQIFCFLLPSLVYVLKEKNLDGFQVKKIELKEIPFICVFSLSISIVCLMLSSAFFMTVGGDGGFARVSVMGGATVQFGLMVGAAIPAICEELLLRGLVLYHTKQLGSWSIVLSGVTFAMLHGNLDNLIGPLIAGCFYALLTLKYESVFPAMIAHFIYNGYIYLMGRVVMQLGGGDALFILLLNVVILFFCIYGIILYYEKRKGERIFGFVEDMKKNCGIQVKPALLSIPFLMFTTLYLIKIVIVYI